jgi:hypothetical protein
MINLSEIEAAAREASEEADGDWFDPDLIESAEPILSSAKARRHIAATSPEAVLALVAVAKAAMEVDSLVIPPIVEPAFAALREALKPFNLPPALPGDTQ